MGPNRTKHEIEMWKKRKREIEMLWKMSNRTRYSAQKSNLNSFSEVLFYLCLNATHLLKCLVLQLQLIFAQCSNSAVACRTYILYTHIYGWIEWVWMDVCECVFSSQFTFKSSANIHLKFQLSRCKCPHI